MVHSFLMWCSCCTGAQPWARRGVGEGEDGLCNGKQGAGRHCQGEKPACQRRDNMLCVMSWELMQQWPVWRCCPAGCRLAHFRHVLVAAVSPCDAAVWLEAMDLPQHDWPPAAPAAPAAARATLLPCRAPLCATSCLACLCWDHLTFLIAPHMTACRLQQRPCSSTKYAGDHHWQGPLPI